MVLEDATLSLQGAWVQSLVREIKSGMHHHATRKKKKNTQKLAVICHESF